MFIPHAFNETDLRRLDALIADNPFVTLIRSTASQTPQISHLPVLYRRDGQAILLEGHWARANPQAHGDGTALAIVHGPHGYISPGWYPDKESAARVPTWNYAVAHLHGRLECYADQNALASLVARTSRRFEQTLGGDWEFEPECDRQRRQLRGIIGFRLHVQRVEMQFKLSQNHPLPNRRAVIAALSAQARDQTTALAALMRDTLPNT